MKRVTLVPTQAPIKIPSHNSNEIEPLVSVDTVSSATSSSKINPLQTAALLRESTVSKIGQDVLPDKRNKKYHIVDDLDLLDSNFAKQFLETLRLESYLRVLPASEKDNPSLFPKVKRYLQGLINEGSLVLYNDGSNIYDEKKGCMQIVLAGTLQMIHNRYSRKIPELSKIGFDGARFTSGMAVGSWSMAGNTGSNWGEIVAVGPALVLTISGDQYEKLIRLTLDQPNFAKNLGTVSNEEMEALKAAHVIKTYPDSNGDLFIVDRQRDFNKSEASKVPQMQELWEKLKLAQTDFITYQDEKWIRYEHIIQRAIKNSTATQHILQKNFLYSDKEIEKLRNDGLLYHEVAGAFQTPLANEEFLTLSRNLQLVDNNVDIEGEQVLNQIHFIVFKTNDVENPDKPLKGRTSGALGNIQVRASWSDSNIKQVKDLVLPISFHGVIDPKQVFSSLVKQGIIPASAKLEKLSVSTSNEMNVYSLDCNKYYDELEGSGYYSWNEMIRQLEVYNYVFKDGNKEKLIRLFDKAEDAIEGFNSEATPLSYKARRELIQLMSSWLKRDLYERKGGDPVDFNEARLNEIGGIFAIYVKAHVGTISEELSHYESLMTAALKEPDKKKQLWVGKVETVANQQLDSDWMRKQNISERNYRDVKHALSMGVNDFHRNASVKGLLVSTLEDLNVEWSKYENKEVIVIPDRHENLWGFLNELKAMKVINEDGSLCVENMHGKRLIFIGDGINRQASQYGVGILQALNRLMDEAREFNFGEASENTIDIEMIIGNHEKDFLVAMNNEETVNQLFPQLGQRLIANYCQKLLTEMIAEGKIKAATYLGDHNSPEDQERHAIAVHSVLLPSVQKVFMQELPPEKRNDLELVEHLNQVLCEAVSSNNYSHGFFAKSTLRGGLQKFSGPLEVDASDSVRSDLRPELVEMGILNNEGNLLITPAEAEEKLVKAFVPQIVGHSFQNERNSISVLTINKQLIKIPTVILSDSGCNQVFTADPMERLSALYINKGKAQAVKADACPGLIKLQTEEDVYDLSKSKTVQVSILGKDRDYLEYLQKQS